MIENGVENPTVVGFLVFRDTIVIFIMDLRHEALYFAMPFDEFTIPMTLRDLSAFGDEIGKLLTAKVRVACHLVHGTAYSG